MDPLAKVLQPFHQITDKLKARLLSIRSLGELLNDMVGYHPGFDMLVEKETHPRCSD